MAVIIPLPPNVESQLRAEWPELERHALESFVTEAFRNGKLSSHEVSQILGLESRWNAVRFLEARGAYPGTDTDELTADRNALSQTLKGASR